jgi:signal transduction histidine kinase
VSVQNSLMTQFRRKKISFSSLVIVTMSLLLIITCLLVLFVRLNYSRQKSLVLEAYIDLEYQIVKQTARLSDLWIKEKIKSGVSLDQAEQDIFKNIIDPILILSNGDAWIYNKDHVIYDKSADFPDIYKGKSITQIFELQKKQGAYHYNELIKAVETAGNGKGWYVWLPDKGKEWGAWTSFTSGSNTWTIGISTPENEICEYYNLNGYLLQQSIFAVIIFLLFFSVFALFVRSHHLEKKRSDILSMLVNDLNQTNEKLYRLDSLKNDFIANITHDFRSPLTAILGITELNMRKKPSPWDEARDAFQIIFTASYKLLDTIDRLLDIAKMDAGGLKLAVRKEDPVYFISTIISYHTALVRNTGIFIEGILPDYEIDDFYTDKNKLEEILNNILANATKFVDKQTGRISVTCRDLPGFIEITISDNGVGIEEADIEKIFNRFEQGESGRSVTRRGSGIGLAFSKQLTESLKGTIRAESEGKGKGSSFILTFPKGKNHFKDQDFAKE